MSKRKETKSLAGVTYTQDEIAQLVLLREGYQIEISKLNNHPDQGRIGFTALDAPAVIDDGDEDDGFYEE